MALINNRQRNCLQLEADLILALITIPPRIDKFMSSRQDQISR
jgi:hypothetical protein